MKFKVGDRVKVTCNNTGSDIVKEAMNKIGIIFSIKHMIFVKFDKGIWQDLTVLGFKEDEIEKVFRKGEQLLFSFMKQ